MNKLIIRFASRLLISCLITACSTSASFIGNWEGNLAFSNFEKMSAQLMIKSDSTFIFLKKTNENSLGLASFGGWSQNDNTLVLDGGTQFQLLLKLQSNKLEVLDFEGNEVIGNKKLNLSKQLDSIRIAEKFIATGDFTYFADAASIRFYKANDSYPIATTGDYINAERFLLTNRKNDSITTISIKAVFSFIQVPNMEGVVKEHIMIHQMLDVN